MEKSSNAFTDFFLAGTSASLAKTLVAPIERVKLLLQLQDAKKGMQDTNKYKSITNCFIRIYKEQGILSFWRGNLSNVIRYFPTQAINFAFKGIISRYLSKYKSNTGFTQKFVVNLLSGGIAGSISIVIVRPLDFTRTRMATDLGKTKVDREFKSTTEVVLKILQSDGITGIYRGVWVSVLCAFIYRALYFGIFDTGKEKFFKDFNNSNFFVVWGFAQFVTIFAGLFAYPFDTVSRRLMMQSGRSDVIYTGAIDCFVKIYSNEQGLRGFFKGGATNIIRGTGGALVLVFYNNLQSYVESIK